LSFVKFSTIIFWNIFPVPLDCISSPLSMPMLHRFGFWMDLWSFAYSFCDTVLYSSLFPLLSVLSLNAEVLFSTCSSFRERLSTAFFI
jgi:hypothetical protein